MYKYLGFIFILFVNAGYADPFYKENNPPNNTSFAENSVKRTACTPSGNLEKLNLTSSFDQLKLIGIIQYNEQTKALFINSEGQLIDVKENNLILPSMLEIKRIDQKGITYVDWGNTSDCLNPILVAKKL